MPSPAVLPTIGQMTVSFSSCVQRLSLPDMLFSQGFGTRRVCTGLVQQGLVRLGHEVVTDSTQSFDFTDGTAFQVQGQAWQFQRKAYVLMHKPQGYECSQKPSHWPSVLSLLPMPLRMRPNKGMKDGVQPVGRLDQDTTGLLLLTDDGKFLHRMASPKHHKPKVYQVLCKHAVEPGQIAQLLAGVVLDDNPQPVRADACTSAGPQHLALTLTQGKYHQVKRMVAAVGNRVEALHRSQIGQLHLPPDLPAGQWRWLQAHELAALLQPEAARPSI